MSTCFSVLSPKRRSSSESFARLFPYYAGFPESFVHSILSSNVIRPGSLIYDPWNGSGTTTAVASEMGLPSIGIDINPVMVVVAKARLLPRSERYSLRPIANAVLDRSRSRMKASNRTDPLVSWFTPTTAAILRSIEREICNLLVDPKPEWTIDAISGTASALYVALFASYRKHMSALRGSNPSWIKARKEKDQRLKIDRSTIETSFLNSIDYVAALHEASNRNALSASAGDIRLADATNVTPGSAVDCILTSPPYCTRIDYTAATRIELAILHELVKIDTSELNRSMIGTTKVPNRIVERRDSWGETCNRFLDAVASHKSKASGGYYLRTHLDYFDKMQRSMTNMTGPLRDGGYAIMILQDSYYKDVHNDVALIVSEMGSNCGLTLQQKVDFPSLNCMSRINPRAQSHGKRSGAIESVLILRKDH